MIKYIITEHSHELIKKIYQENTGNNEVKNLAKRLQLPRWKVTRYAINQGWIAKQKKEPNWSKKELHILENTAQYCPEIIQKKLKKAGYKRSTIAIVLKRKRMRFLNNLNGQSANMLAECFGIDIHCILKAINQGKLQAKRRGTKRTANQGGDIYFIKDKNIKTYIIENINEIDIRKVDKYWLVDILTAKL